MPSLGGFCLASAGSNRIFTLTTVVGGVSPSCLVSLILKARGCAAAITIYPDLPLRAPFLISFSFCRQYSVSSKFSVTTGGSSSVAGTTRTLLFPEAMTRTCRLCDPSWYDHACLSDLSVFLTSCTRTTYCIWQASGDRSFKRLCPFPDTVGSPNDGGR